MIRHYRKISLFAILLPITLYCNARGGLAAGISQGKLVLLLSGLIGGLGIFLMGIRMMSDSLTKSTGNQIRKLLERQHYNRLKMEVEDSVESSRTHMEIIGAFKVIGSHATNMARIILKEHQHGGESAH